MSRFTKIAKRAGNVLIFVVIAWLLISGTVFNMAKFVFPHINAWKHSNAAPANQPVEDFDDPNRNPFQPSPFFGREEDDLVHRYVTCDNAASLRLVYKWLRIPHKGDLADRCMSFDEIVPLVQRELPKLHAYIDDTNREVDAQWQKAKAEIQAVANQPDHHAAAEKLLSMLCDGEGYSMTTSVYQWTLFRDATPAGVRKAIEELYFMDYVGYGGVFTMGHGSGPDTQEVFDEYYYKSQMENGPGNRHPNRKEGEYLLDYYGLVGNRSALASRLIESLYEANRMLDNIGGLPIGFRDGSTGTVCIFR
ncbi:MAG: hypothetical protein WAW80_04140 [Candidatus Saccharimonadales bacterium]